MLNYFVQSPILNLLSGLVLLLTAGYETWLTIAEFSVGAHHGVLFFGIAQIIKSLPEILQASKELSVAEKSTS